jgi:hypothetical protein
MSMDSGSDFKTTLSISIFLLRLQIENFYFITTEKVLEKCF